MGDISFKKNSLLVDGFEDVFNPMGPMIPHVINSSTGLVSGYGLFAKLEDPPCPTKCAVREGHSKAAAHCAAEGSVPVQVHGAPGKY